MRGRAASESSARFESPNRYTAAMFMLDRIGQQHFLLCENLLQESLGTEEREAQAAAALPPKLLQEADKSLGAAWELLAVTERFENVGSAKRFVRYLFAYSVFLAAEKEGLDRHLSKMSGRRAAVEIEIAAAGFWERKEHDSLEEACQRLVVLGTTLEDHYATVAGWAYRARLAKKAGEDVLFDLMRRRAMQFLPLPKEELVDDKLPRPLLSLYESLLRA